MVKITDQSVVYETEAIIPDNAPIEWNLPYLNMVLKCETDLSPYQLLDETQRIEAELGRPYEHLKWSPRIIDVDILLYGDQIINDSRLNIPHPGIKDRPFLQNLLNFMGCSVEYDDYYPVNTYILNPKIVGIINVTPDSFSDGGDYFSQQNAINAIKDALNNGAYIAELGAQSTRPGYTEISPSEEINRLSMVLENYDDPTHLGVDTYFDDVALYCLKKGIRWINDIRGELSERTLKAIAEAGATLVIMLTGMNIEWLFQRVDYLTNLGIPKSKIVLDPGLGFGKRKFENLLILKELPRIKESGCEVLLGHSRKSFIGLFSGADIPPKDRDIETLVLSLYANTDYLRIHNVRNHMKALVAQDIARRFTGSTRPIAKR